MQKVDECVFKKEKLGGVFGNTQIECGTNKSDRCYKENYKPVLDRFEHLALIYVKELNP